ncbi:AraC-like DNA-binding protein [Propionibacteriaceae bacterium ES.041]|uniref:AraC-like ligand-binding domain-containing protein n=1 Tax=Enemella evansiae TaxID=2016499 RepID=UPI000C005610|nr:helix-turn-helix domain-containing protein [Enemella evansiae]PFG65602.1 AraC-like DNA-binding protein [Propionibacteriaceae bacterium ES.041]
MGTNDPIRDTAVASDWQATIAQAFDGLRARPLDGDDGPVTGRLTGRRFDDVGLYDLASSSQTVHRSPGSARRAGVHLLKLSLSLRGRAIVDQAETQVEIRPGEFAIYDTSRPYSLTAFGPWHTLVMTVPRALLPIPQREFDRLRSRPHDATRGAGALLTGYLRAGTQQPDPGTAAEGTRIRDAGLALLEGALAGAVTTATTDARTAIRALAVQQIRARLADPELSPASVAAACHLSARSLHRAFEGSGSTVAEEIRRSRLDAIRRDLENPVLRHTTIAGLAARWCVWNQAWLSRAFKREYGVSPSDYRAQHGAP